MNVKGEVNVKEKMDALDLIINVLRDHEKALDDLERRFEKLMRRLDKNDVEEKSIVAGSSDVMSTILALLEYQPFSNSSFSFECKVSADGCCVLTDYRNNRALSFGRSDIKANIPLWSVNVFEGEEKTDSDPVESCYFDSESSMHAWPIRYVLRAEQHVEKTA
jgi:hypothetical protein